MEMSTSAMIPPRRESAPDNMPWAPAMRVCNALQARAMLEVVSLDSDPSGPGGRPLARVASARAAVQRCIERTESSFMASWRNNASPRVPVACSCGATRSGRPARWGYHT